MYLANMTWQAISALDKNIPVVIPIAAVEQHGHHLPVYTDSYLLGEVVRRAEAAVGDKALFAPLQWLGNSDHHIDFPVISCIARDGRWSIASGAQAALAQGPHALPPQAVEADVAQSDAAQAGTEQELPSIDPAP